MTNLALHGSSAAIFSHSPAAEEHGIELVGAITLKLDDYTPSPIGTFTFKDTVFKYSGDQQAHQAFGAWIAKQAR